MFVILIQEMTARKNITAVFLLCCFSVMLGHNLIPHHHHHEQGTRMISHHCSSDKKDHSDEDSPIHCHAFNDSFFFKSAVIKIIQPLFSGNFILMRDEFLFSLPNDGDPNPWLIPVLPLKEQEFTFSSPYRGPPLSA